MGNISLVTLLVLGFVSLVGWLLSFIWLGWLANAAIWLWARGRGLKMKNPTHDLMVHLLSTLASFIPFMPAAFAQYLILHLANKKMPK